VISSIAAMAGYTTFSRFSAEVIAATEAVAAGAILAMIPDTMVRKHSRSRMTMRANNGHGLRVLIRFVEAQWISEPFVCCR
jgi:zinc transporter, ZIP family